MRAGTPGVGPSERRRSGMVLVAVLLVLLAVGAIAFAMSLEAGLTTLGARAAAGAAASRPAARAALALAMEEVVAAGGWSGPTPARLGPWAGLAEDVVATLVVDDASTPPVYRLTATVETPRSRAEASAVFVLAPTPSVLEWREP